MGFEDAERLRRRQDDADDAVTRSGGLDDSGSPCIVGKTVEVGTYPTTAGAFYGIAPQVVSGAEDEGEDGDLADAEGQFWALNLGGAIPDEGTAVICRFVNYRWVFRHDTDPS